MSVIQRITPEGTPFETVNTFQATFNAAGTGVYDFAFDQAQQGQVVLSLNRNYVYLIDRVTFAATTDQGIYLSAINTNPEFRLRYSHDNLIAFPNPIRAITYHDAMEFSFWLWTDRAREDLTCDMSGVLNQVAALIGVPQVFASLSLVVYQENNSDIVRAIKDRTARQAGVRFYRDVA